MPIEIERAFLVTDRSFVQQRTEVSKIHFYGYLESPDASICIRHIIGKNKDEGRINIKSRGSKISRLEHEVCFDAKTAKELMFLCKSSLTKIRHYVGKWEIDDFLGPLKGLTIAEIELKDSNDSFEIHDWLGKEVTHDIRYSNEMLAKNGIPK